MRPENWNYKQDTTTPNNGDVLARKVFFNNDKENTPLVMNTAFNMDVLLQELLMFEDGDAILYREKNLSTNEFVFITFSDLKEVIINLKRTKGLNGILIKED